MSTAYPDLPAAMIGWLRAQPTIVAAFGEDTSALATTKFWADEAHPGVALPWAVYEEVSTTTTYMTAAGGATASLDDSVIRFVVVAPGKSQARTLGKMIARALTDAPLAFEDGTLMMIRPTTSMFVPSGDIAPGNPAVYVRVVGFSIMVSRSTLTP